MTPVKYAAIAGLLACVAWFIVSWSVPPQGIYSIDLSQKGRRIISGHLQLGSNRNSNGEVLDANSLYFIRNGKPWFPVMGEFHFSRYPREQWEESILKMKAAGIDVIATYIFWIYHEETEGVWDWSGNRDLAHFASLCARHNVYLFARIGPWSHGEVRNGGFPDWLLQKTKTRRNDPAYLDYVKKFYEQIHRQLKGHYFKEGGPVIGSQIENEYRFNNPAGLEHILTLKKMAREAGIDVPYYTATGWPGSNVKQTELVPVWGAYPEAPWDKSTGRLKLSENYLFGPLRMDPTIGSDILGNQPADTTNFTGYRYPYATAEMGGGNQVTYHRRPIIQAPDVVSLAYVKTGSGANLMGYYMFHGGSNAIGKLSTLQESKATRYPNDYPIINYDFYAPIGQWGEVRPSYREFKTLHLFLNDFGDRLATTYAFFPGQKPTGPSDISTLRWSARCNENDNGFIFISNFQRQVSMVNMKDVQFRLKLSGDSVLHVPGQPVTIPGGVSVILPFNFDVEGALLKYATAQPLCRLDAKEPVYVFFAPEGIDPEYVFDTKEIQSIQATGGTASLSAGTWKVAVSQPGTACITRIKLKNGKQVKVLTLTRQQATDCWKAKVWGAERLFLSGSDLIFGNEGVRMQSTGNAALKLTVYPAPEKVNVADAPVKTEADGIFSRYTVSLPEKKIKVNWYEDERLHKDTSLMTWYDTSSHASMPLYGAELQALPKARYWRVYIPSSALQGLSNAFVQFDYRGDTYAAYLQKKLIQDDFYAGLPATIALKPFASRIPGKELIVLVTPLVDTMKIYFEPGVREPLQNRLAAELREIKVVPQYEVFMKAGSRQKAISNKQ